jgi:hypothetical protein
LHTVPNHHDAHYDPGSDYDYDKGGYDYGSSDYDYECEWVIRRLP